MFDKFDERLGRPYRRCASWPRYRGKRRRDLREVRMACSKRTSRAVIKTFIDSVRRAACVEVATSLTPGQAFIGILHRELVVLLGESSQGFALNVQPPQVVLLAGLQGG